LKFSVGAQNKLRSRKRLVIGEFGADPPVALNAAVGHPWARPLVLLFLELMRLIMQEERKSLYKRTRQ